MNSLSSNMDWAKGWSEACPRRGRCSQQTSPNPSHRIRGQASLQQAHRLLRDSAAPWRRGDSHRLCVLPSIAKARLAWRRINRQSKRWWLPLGNVLFHLCQLVPDQLDGIAAQQQVRRRIIAFDQFEHRQRVLFGITQLLAAFLLTGLADGVERRVVVADGPCRTLHRAPCPIRAERSGGHGGDSDVEGFKLLVQAL